MVEGYAHDAPGLVEDGPVDDGHTEHEGQIHEGLPADVHGGEDQCGEDQGKNWSEDLLGIGLDYTPE